ncbi:hypothetical protein NPIL_131461 [Nephila pilipes]|uniref:Sm domain-containing protein n=1 Tax=Nephila pilipes TaxID=299642 RepID=A0A8X6MS28_NEPPI|nr:hypothetical protein NPIL_303331 [Nephila pilipes]GFT68643.1 hypothetical protein NPIL_516341 [Nephila pilipes]GFU03234.1 hypothetical protein NPIL_563921 [Nephila pilipes]GFU47107.1 hypothetical protein NPIL_131461 [Nephila pilipes]
MSVQITNPAPFLGGLIGKWINVRLKYGLDICGKLVSTDAYMNVSLECVKQKKEIELCDDESGRISKLMIRCNNILHVRELNDEESEGMVSYWKSRNEKEEE